MNELLIGLLGALMATNQSLAVSNVVQQQTGISVNVPNPNDPAEQALDKVMAEDDAASAEVDKWIRENNAFAAQGAGEPRAELNKRIMARFVPVQKAYEDFLKQYPNYAPGHLAYGSFLNDIGDELKGMEQYKIAARLNPKDPAVWNNMANYYGENGSVTNAFADYEKAIQLNPGEPVYYENLATTVYLFRKDAEKFYGLTETQVFDKALELYRKAAHLDPDNFALATDYAQTYYGIRPLRTNDALVAWTNALNVAHNDEEREGVYIHLARIKMVAGRFSEASAQLSAVTNSRYAVLKRTLERDLVEREKAATNFAAAANISTNVPSVLATNGVSTNAAAPPKADGLAHP